MQETGLDNNSTVFFFTVINAPTCSPLILCGHLLSRIQPLERSSGKCPLFHASLKVASQRLHFLWLWNPLFWRGYCRKPTATRSLRSIKKCIKWVCTALDTHEWPTASFPLTARLSIIYAEVSASSCPFKLYACPDPPGGVTHRFPTHERGWLHQPNKPVESS